MLGVGLPRGGARCLGDNPGRMDHEDRAGPGRLARRLPTAFMPPGLLLSFLHRLMGISLTTAEKRLPTTFSEGTFGPQQCTPCRDLRLAITEMD